MRKAIIALAVGASAITLAACGNDTETQTTEQPVVIEETERTPAIIEREVEVDENVVEEGETQTETNVEPVGPEVPDTDETVAPADPVTPGTTVVPAPTN